jgi:hypothetical protein
VEKPSVFGAGETHYICYLLWRCSFFDASPGVITIEMSSRLPKPSVLRMWPHYELQLQFCLRSLQFRGVCRVHWEYLLSVLSSLLRTVPYASGATKAVAFTALQVPPTFITRSRLSCATISHRVCHFQFATSTSFKL